MLESRHDDLEAIKVLTARYWRFMDTKQWEPLRTLFTDDMVMSAPDDAPGRPPTVGADAVVGRISSFLADAVSVHHGFAPEVEILGLDAAAATWAMSDVVTWRSDPARSFAGAGHYDIRYRRTDSGWMICEMTLRRLILGARTPAGRSASEG
jgi:hypothetical protein